MIRLRTGLLAALAAATAAVTFATMLPSASASDDQPKFEPNGSLTLEFDLTPLRSGADHVKGHLGKDMVSHQQEWHRRVGARDPLDRAHQLLSPSIETWHKSTETSLHIGINVHAPDHVKRNNSGWWKGLAGGAAGFAAGAAGLALCFMFATPTIGPVAGAVCNAISGAIGGLVGSIVGDFLDGKTAGDPTVWKKGFGAAIAGAVTTAPWSAWGEPWARANMAGLLRTVGTWLRGASLVFGNWIRTGMAMSADMLDSIAPDVFQVLADMRPAGGATA